MKTIILAGGRGTRLQHLARDIPKPMMPVGGKPLLSWQIECFRRYGFTDIMLITGHLSPVIEEFYGDGRDLGVSLSYYVEQTPLGTTGGIREVMPWTGGEPVMVSYGDVMFDMDLARLAAFHEARGAMVTLVVHPNDHPYDSDLVELGEGGRITAFHPKPHRQGMVYHNMVNAGLFVLAPGMVPLIPEGEKLDFGRDLFPRWAGRYPLYGYATAEYLKDMGTADRLALVTEDVVSGKVARWNREHKRPAMFLDRDGVLNKEVDLLHRPEQLVLYPEAIEAVKLLNGSDYLAVVVTNQPVIARGMCTLDDMDAIHKALETALGQHHARLDALYFCPHHPDRGYPGENPEFKVSCRCRKPGTGMLEQAVADWNIDMSRSALVGDSWRDIACGRAMKIATMGVRTGYGCRDKPCTPDRVCDNVLDAVQYWLSRRE